MRTSNRTLKERAYSQLKDFLWITLYLWVVLGVLIQYKSVVLADYHIDFVNHGLALINALALAKVMLIAKDLHLGERSNQAPLIYPTLLKSAVYTVVLACFKVLEEFAIGLYHHESFHESIAHVGGGTLKGILTLSAVLFVVLIPFVGFTELQGVIGKDKLAQIFFRQRPSENQPIREAQTPDRV